MPTEVEELKDALEAEALPEEQPPQATAATTYELVKSLYKDDFGRPFSMTPAQNEIFDAIFKKSGPSGQKRIWIATHTQFGKSDTVSMAVLTRVATFAEKWCIVAPSQAKARIIMGYLIKHIFDNEYTAARFKIGDGESADVIRRERSKNRLTFDCGDNKVGEVFILSAESRLKNGEDAGNAMMGFGAPNVVEDEAALISDEADAKAMRMVGGFSGSGSDFVVKIGNPFTRGHFRDAYEDPAYHKINVAWERGIKEKNEYGESRLTQEFIDEMKKKPYFRVLYENKFPEVDDMDARGWTQLLTEDEVELAIATGDEPPAHVGERRIGNDVARGGANQTVWSLRSMNYAEVLAKSHQDNLTEIAGQTLFFMTENKVPAENVFIDDVGVGGGAVDPLKSQNKNVRGVNVGTPALEDTRFANLRAEAYWRLREWVKRGGKLDGAHREDWVLQLSKVKYKPDSKGRLRIMSKDEMRAQGIESPDVADSLMLTFVRQGTSESFARKKALAAKKKKMRTGNGLKVRMGGYR